MRAKMGTLEGRGTAHAAGGAANVGSEDVLKSAQVTRVVRDSGERLHDVRIEYLFFYEVIQDIYGILREALHITVQHYSGFSSSGIGFQLGDSEARVDRRIMETEDPYPSVGHLLSIVRVCVHELGPVSVADARMDRIHRIRLLTCFELSVTAFWHCIRSTRESAGGESVDLSHIKKQVDTCLRPNRIIRQYSKLDVWFRRHLRSIGGTEDASSSTKGDGRSAFLQFILDDIDAMLGM